MKSTVERTKEEKILKILVEQAPVGVCIMQDGKFCHINSYFSATTRYTLDELVGKDSFVIVFPEDREAVRKIQLIPLEMPSVGLFPVLRLPEM